MRKKSLKWLKSIFSLEKEQSNTEKRKKNYFKEIVLSSFKLVSIYFHHTLGEQDLQACQDYRVCAVEVCWQPFAELVLVVLVLNTACLKFDVENSKVFNLRPHGWCFVLHALPLATRLVYWLLPQDTALSHDIYHNTNYYITTPSIIPQNPVLYHNTQYYITTLSIIPQHPILYHNTQNYTKTPSITPQHPVLY